MRKENIKTLTVYDGQPELEFLPCDDEPSFRISDIESGNCLEMREVPRGAKLVGKKYGNKGKKYIALVRQV